MISFYPIISVTDIGLINEIRNECAEKFLHCSIKYSIEETKNWYINLKTPYYMVCFNDVRIGYFRTSNYSEINKNMYIGMDLHKDWRGKNLAKKSYISFIPYVFDHYMLNKISLEVLSTNSRAIHIYKYLGFVIEGIKREEIVKNGMFVDSVIMSLLKKEMVDNPLYIS